MYGYVTPDKPNLLLKEYTLYRAHYCGICKATGQLYGQFPRFAVNYDITFFSIFLHNYLDISAEYYDGRCIANPVGQKKRIVRPNELLERVIAVNIIMAYHNLRDDVIDGEGLKKIAAASFFKRAYKKAAKKLPDAVGIVTEKYNKLLNLEKEKCDSIDRVADCFASMLAECALLAAGQYPLGAGAAGVNAFPPEEEREKKNEPAALHAFFYNLGRWVYLTDALDDLDEDHKKGKYNPYLAAFPGFQSREQFITDNYAEISFGLYGSINQMARIFTGFDFRQSKNLLQNVVIYGISKTTKTMLETKQKLVRERM